MGQSMSLPPGYVVDETKHDFEHDESEIEFENEDVSDSFNEPQNDPSNFRVRASLISSNPKILELSPLDSTASDQKSDCSKLSPITSNESSDLSSFSPSKKKVRRGPRMSIMQGLSYVSKRISVFGSTPKKRRASLRNGPSGPRDSVLSLGNDVEFMIEEDVWVQGKATSVKTNSEGEKVYEVQNFDNDDHFDVERGSLRTHDSTTDIYGKQQSMKRRVTLVDDGLIKVMQFQMDKSRKGYGFAGWRFTFQRLKQHTIPICICIVLIVVWILLAEYDMLTYVDDGTLSLGGGHRRFLEDDSHSDDPCAHRRFLEDDSSTHDKAAECVKTVPLPSDAYLVGAVISCCIVFLLMEYPGWVVMILGGTVLTLSDTITEDAMWHAMSFPTIIACCSITAVAKGLANTHFVRIMMEKIIDFNRGDFFTLTMLLLVTGLLSTLVDNFAIIGIFRYVYAVFGQKTNIDSKVLLISLSYISMIGGTCTVLASGAMLVARSFLEQLDSEFFPHLDDQKNLGMFEMSLAAFPVLFVSAPFLAWWAPYRFGKKVDAENVGAGAQEHSTAVEHGHTEHGFIMKYQVGPKCDVSHLHKIENATYLYKEVIGKSGKRGVIHVNKDKDLKRNDVVYILTPGNMIHDLKLHNYKLMELNPQRGNRIEVKNHVIAEGIVDPDADFIGIPYGELGSHIRHWHVIGKYHPDKHWPEIDFLRKKVKGGDILLLEGQHHALLEEHTGFIHIAEHDDGHHHDIYLFQLLVSGACLLFIIIATVLEVLSLLQTVIISLVILNQTGCLTMEEMLYKFKWRVLLLVTGAYAIAHAFVDTMLAEYLTQRLMDITESDTGMLIVMYVLSIVLGLCFPPKAEIGILYPICLTLAQKRPTLQLKKLVIVVLQGTAIQLLTPNNPENSLIADGYTFKDFMLCGAPLAILSGLIFIPILEMSY